MPYTITRTKTAIVLVTGMLTMSLMLSFIVGGIANSVQAQKASPATNTKDIFKVIVTIYGLNKTSGDVVSFVNVNGTTQVKTFNAAKLLPMRGNDGTLDIAFSFPNAIINTGVKFRACTLIVKDLLMSCGKGKNSPALRPEFVDTYLSSAKLAKISSASSIDKKYGK